MLIGILAYVAVQLVVGIVVSRRIHGEDDYLVAGRRLGPLLASASIFATWFGAETCLSATGAAHDEGAGVHSVEPFAYGLCLLLMGLIFAAPFWRRRITTLADLFRTRYSPATERIAALILVPTSVLWAAAQVRAFGTVLAAEATFDIETGIAIASVIAIVYTFAGGLLADVYTDLVQGTVLVLGLAAIAVATVAALGGWSEAVAAVPGDRIRFGLGADEQGIDLLEMWALPVIGSIVAQEAVQRALASRSARVARASGLIGGSFYIVIGLIPIALGLVAPAILDTHGEALGDDALPQLARTVLSSKWVYVAFAGALVSAILSTVDSALLVSASLVARNLLPRPLIERGGERRKLLVARGAVVAFGFVAWKLALESDRVFDLIEEASGFGSAGIFVIVVFGLFSKIGGPRAAIASLLGATATWIYLVYPGAARVMSFGADQAYETTRPFLHSLAVAFAAFFLGAIFDRRHSLSGFQSSSTPK